MGVRMARAVISKITDMLYLGNATAASDTNILSEFGIMRIVSVTDEPAHRPTPDFCKQYSLTQMLYPIPDKAFWDRNEKLTSIVFPWVKDGAEKNQRVFVHCRAGVSRSASFVITYLMWLGLDFDSALIQTFAAHPFAAPSPEVLKTFLQLIGKNLPLYYPHLCRMRRGQNWFKEYINQNP
ncbi:MAG: dual specificity protein phosphatase family protein [Candidatus Sungbacteria bacterium]|nr:dual specificity protein phosphatase family protein [Candidatus Sungbacteria bacterium]